MAECDCNGVFAWEAWHDRMPGAKATLHVVGTCLCPTPGFVLQLRRRVHQGANPKDLLLDLIETAPTAPQAQVVTEELAVYREETEESYETVSIMPDGPSGIPVREVSKAG
jgi:hypothetical protein